MRKGFQRGGRYCQHWLVFGASLALAWLAPVSVIHAHAVYTTHIRHNARIHVSPENIDLAIELTFHELPSLAERRRMDRNHDSNLSADELEGYGAGLAQSLCDAVEVTIDGWRAQVIPLWDPEIDLLGVEGVAPTHHVLRFSCFVRTPSSLRAGSEIVVADRLWSGAPAIPFFEAEGTDGIQMSRVQTPMTSAGDGRAVIARVECLEVPPGVGHQPSLPRAEEARLVWSVPDVSGFDRGVASWALLGLVVLAVISTIRYGASHRRGAGG